jgi:hypothetical protein
MFSLIAHFVGILPKVNKRSAVRQPEVNKSTSLRQQKVNKSHF